MTTENKEQAKSIGKELLKCKLAACVNIIDNMNSMYWWEGKIEESGEAVLIVKTKEELIPELVERVKSLHSYSCPCIVALPVSGGNKDYLDWVQKETKE